MKRVSEMNGIEKIAYRNIKGVFTYEIGSWYVCLEDNCPEDIPDTIEEAKQMIYEDSLRDTAGKGFYRTGKAPEEMRFAGADFIREVIDHLFSHDEDARVIAVEKNW